MCLTVCAIVLLFVISIPIVNNITAWAVAESLKDSPLPQNTELIESAYNAGRLVGAGNGMQYFGRVLVENELDISEVKTHYSTNETNLEIYVEEQNEQEITADGIGKDSRLLFETDVSDGDYYIVYAWGDGVGIYAELDVRGH